MYTHTRRSWKLHSLKSSYDDAISALDDFSPMGFKHFNTDWSLWTTRGTILKIKPHFFSHFMWFSRLSKKVDSFGVSILSLCKQRSWHKPCQQGKIYIYIYIYIYDLMLKSVFWVDFFLQEIFLVIYNL